MHWIKKYGAFKFILIYQKKKNKREISKKILKEKISLLISLPTVLAKKAENIER